MSIDFNTLPISKKLEPSAVEVEAGKTYNWCTCGLTQNDTGLCDGSHKASWTTDENGETIKHFKNLSFTAETTGVVWICNCKHTKSPPYCDGSHKMLPQPPTDI